MLQVYNQVHIALLSNAVAITSHIDDMAQYTLAFLEEKESVTGYQV